VVVLWSRKSVASRWVRAEATQADRSGTLVPAMIEDCKRPIMFELKQTADLSKWSGDPDDKGWQGYLASVRRFVEKGSVGAGAAVPMPSPPATLPPPKVTRSTRKPGFQIVAVVIAVALAGAVWWLSSHRGEQKTNPLPGTTIAVPAQATVSLAVLPFADMSAAKDQEYFSDGLSEEILNQLAQVKALRVTGRTSSFSFKGKNEDLRVIGEKLGVGNLLEGSVRKEGNQLRITAQLISSKDGSHLWSKTYARDLSDVFAVQEEVARDVAHALSVTLDVGDMSRSDGGTTNVEAYDKFLLARKLTDGGGKNELERAIPLYREAVAMDPSFARAWLGLAGSLLDYAPYTPRSQAALSRESDAASKRVVELAPNAWWTHSMRARQIMNTPGVRKNWAEAAEEVTKALEAAPASAFEATATNILVLAFAGRVREACDYLERVRAANPLSLGVSNLLQYFLDATGRPAEALAEYERGKSLAGDHRRADLFALRALMARADADPGIVKARLRDFGNHAVLPMTVYNELAESLDDKVAARAALRRAFENPAYQDTVRIQTIGNFADRLGDKDLAIAALRRINLEMGGIYSALYLWDHYVTDLRSDPKFKDIVRELGLVDYWRSSGNWGDFCKPVGKDDFECH
jgi:TolB-like protein